MPTKVEPWTPPSGRNAQLQAAGQWWDVVRVPRFIGEQALELLGDDVGAVIENPFDGVLCWLIAPRAAAAWDMSALPSIQVWGATAYIEVPAIGSRRGPGCVGAYRPGTPGISPTRRLSSPR
ncbi:hypothetical protein SAZ11_33400 [Streptomyces sp. FXJ1.4098]|nr:hypothetical protein [Streptomyces sp. FXJ1.4098]